MGGMIVVGIALAAVVLILTAGLSTLWIGGNTTVLSFASTRSVACQLASPRERTNSVARSRNFFGSESTSISIGSGSPTFCPRAQLTSIAGLGGTALRTSSNTSVAFGDSR